MTRARLTVFFACVLLATAAPAQFHESPDPGTGLSGSCTYYECCYQCSPIMCWPQGDPTGNYYKACRVTCDWGTCWCDFLYQCYRI